MYNYFMLIGRVNAIYSNGSIELSVKNDFKDSNGTYGEQYIKVVPDDFMVDIVKKQLKFGKVIGVKGRITSTGSGFSSSSNLTLHAVKIMFLD